MQRAALELLALSAVLGACESAEPDAPPDRPAGPPLEVVLLEKGFVRFEGGRMPLEDFVYEVRLRCRAAGDGTPPWLRVVAPRTERPGVAQMAQSLRRQAWDAGVQHVEFELEDR